MKAAASLVHTSLALCLLLGFAAPAAGTTVVPTQVAAPSDEGDTLAKRRRKKRRKRKPPPPAPEPEPEPEPEPPPPPPEPKGPRVLLFPPIVDGDDAQLAINIEAAIVVEVSALHGAGRLHFEGGTDKTAAVKKALGSLLPSCQEKTTCLIEQGQGAGAEFVLATRVSPGGDGGRVQVSLVDVKQASLDASFSRRVPAGAELPSEVASTTKLALRRFLEAGPGTLELVVSEPEATVRIDGQQKGTTPLGPLEVGSGPHLVQVKKDGYHPQDTITEIPRGGTAELELALVPTAELLEAQAFGRTMWAALAWSTVGLGVVTMAGGGGLLGWNVLEAGRVSGEIQAANTEYAATGVPDDVAADLAAQRDQVNLLTGVGGAVVGVGAIIATTGVVLLFLGE